MFVKKQFSLRNLVRMPVLVVAFFLLGNSFSSVWAQGCMPGAGLCADGQCCSSYGFCGSTVEYCGTNGTSQSKVPVNGEKLTDLFVTFADYSALKKGGSIDGFYCAEYGNIRPYPKCEENVWVAYSHSNEPGMTRDFCGKCIKITNKSPSSGKSVTGCILDAKADPGLVLDASAFNQIDDNEKTGSQAGHLMADIEFMECP